MLSKLRLLLMAAATATALLVLIWARPPAQPAQAAGPEMSLGGTGNVLCDDPSKPGQCAAPFVPGDPKAGEFQLTINANVIPAGGYTRFATEVFFGGLTYNQRPFCWDEVVWPDLGSLFCVRALGAGGQTQHGMVGDFPPFPVSTFTGTLVELDVHCPAEGTFNVSLTAFPSSVLGSGYKTFDGPGVLKPVGQQELDLDGDTVPETVDLADALVITCKNPTVDSDNDGCTDLQEQGLSAQQGGLRDPQNFWDFYDVWGRPDPVGDPTGWVRDKAINVFDDILGVAFRFGAERGAPPTKEEALAEALTPPTDETGYHAAFDRGEQVGPNVWDLGPPDGTVNVFDDIFGVAAQFGHRCD